MTHSNIDEYDFFEDELSDYIYGRLDPIQSKKVQVALKESKTTFLKYVSLKEALFLEKGGKTISKKIEDNILSKIAQKHKADYLRVIVRFLKDKVTVSYSDQDDLDFRGVMLGFANKLNPLTSPIGIIAGSSYPVGSWRGSEEGPVSIVRKFKDKKLNIIISPGEKNDEKFLTIILDKNRGVRCELWIEETQSETIEDLAKNKFFHTPVKSEQSAELKFIEKDEPIFTVSLFLQNEA